MNTVTRPEPEYNLEGSVRNALRTLTPQAILKFCTNRVQGQDAELKKAVYMICKYLERIADGRLRSAENWMLTAPSGSGKTEFFRAVSELFRIHEIKVPVVRIDLSQITETGFKGENVSTIPQRILDANPDTDGTAICFLDEADKKFAPSFSHETNVNAAIQANLLTLIEGTELKVDTGDKEKKFNSGKTMFVFMGSFQDVRNEKQKRSRTSAVGFGASFENSGSVTAADDKFHEELTMQDMIDYGMLEELAGRITLLINFHKLSRDDMKRLIDCKVKEISKECGFDIELTKQAEEKLVDVSYGSLGLRHPMNLIKNLSRNAVADVFFDNGFAYRRNKVVITSLETAEIQSKKIIREERENI